MTAHNKLWWHEKQFRWKINGLIGSLHLARSALKVIAELPGVDLSARLEADWAASKCNYLIHTLRKTYFKKYGAKSEPAPVEV